MDMVKIKNRGLLIAFALIVAALPSKAYRTFNAKPNFPSYSDMMAPLIAYQQFYNECLEKLSNLLENTESIEGYIDKTKDPQCWQQYVNYYNAVINEYNNIQKNGTDTGTRNRINSLRRDFKIINSIVNAYNRRTQLSESQFLRLRSTNERCDKFYSDMSLDDFLDGKTPTITYY